MQRDAKVVIDTSGAALKTALVKGIYLMKPNLREFQELTGIRTADETALTEAGRQLIRNFKQEQSLCGRSVSS
jgi:6-phosphofructokinase 2